MWCRQELKRIRRANKGMLVSGNTPGPPAGAEAILKVDSIKVKCFLLGLPGLAPDFSADLVWASRSEA